MPDDNRNSKISRHDLSHVEGSLNIVIPEAVKEYYAENNGLVPAGKIWILENGEESEIAEFLPIKYSYTKDGGTLEKVYLQGIEKGYLTKNLVPFARDWGGNYFCFDKHGAVYFFAIDAWSEKLSQEDNKKKAAKLLAGSFKEFISAFR